MNPLGIEFISVFGLPPIEFIDLAADLGCQHISTGLAPMDSGPNYPQWSLRDSPALRRDTGAALRERGISISLGEGFLIRPGADIRDSAVDIELMRELGVERVNAVSIDGDSNRSFDQLGAFAEIAGAAGMQATLEFLPGLPIGDLTTAAAAIRHVGRPNLRLLIDAMHFFRSGAQAADLAALDPDLIGYAQLCDAPRVSRYVQYAEEARYERLAPGAGELPLLDLLGALPRDIVIGLEIPQRSLAAAGIDPRERLRPCVAAAKSLLAQLEPRSN